jgi:hypothetical protein
VYRILGGPSIESPPFFDLRKLYFDFSSMSFKGIPPLVFLALSSRDTPIYLRANRRRDVYPAISAPTIRVPVPVAALLLHI